MFRIITIVNSPNANCSFLSTKMFTLRIFSLCNIRCLCCQRQIRYFVFIASKLASYIGIGCFIPHEYGKDIWEKLMRFIIFFSFWVQFQRKFFLMYYPGVSKLCFLRKTLNTNLFIIYLYTEQFTFKWICESYHLINV